MHFAIVEMQCGTLETLTWNLIRMYSYLRYSCTVAAISVRYN